MKAKIITIGDEILIGQIVDTNSAWIAEKLNEIGVRVIEKISIADDKIQIIDTIDGSLNNCDILVITGGLGPTKDDITKSTLAEYFNCKLIQHEPTYERVNEMVSKRGADFNKLNQSQAMLPECCTPITNRVGTAPGMWFEKNEKILVSLPGVPFEMETIMLEEILPRLRLKHNLINIVHKTILTFGIPEAILAETIEEWDSNLPSYLKLAYLPNPSGIKLRLSSYNVEKAIAESEIDNQFNKLEKIIPEAIVGYGDVSIEESIANMMIDKNLKLAVAESCTGGTICNHLTAMQGASKYFLGGIVAYSNEAKVNLLGVKNEDIQKYGAVSSDVAKQMAEGAKKAFKADYSIATTGIAGPTGGSEEKPVGTVWIAIATPKDTYVEKYITGSLRKQNIARAVSIAVNMLRKILQEL